MWPLRLIVSGAWDSPVLMGTLRSFQERAVSESKPPCIEVLEGKVIKIGPPSVISSTCQILFLDVNWCERLMTTVRVLALSGE